MFSLQEQEDFFRKFLPSQEVPLLRDNAPQTILYTDGLPSESNPPQEISIARFMEIYKQKGGVPFHYTETVWYHPEAKRLAGITITDKRQDYRVFDGKFREMLLDPRQYTKKLIVSFIDEKVGFGVFANEDILPFQFIAVYSGVFGISDTQYALGSSKLGGWSVDALRRGGISRFIQHMPLSMNECYQQYQEFKKGNVPSEFFVPTYISKLQQEKSLLTPEQFVTRFSQECFDADYLSYQLLAEQPNIACENVSFISYIVDGMPLFVFYSTQKILRYAPVGYSYSCNYWRRHPNPNCLYPYLFNKDGSVSRIEYFCNTCSVIAPEMKRCMGCKKTYYCSINCQKKDWSAHKLQCKPAV